MIVILMQSIQLQNQIIDIAIFLKEKLLIVVNIFNDYNLCAIASIAKAIAQMAFCEYLHKFNYLYYHEIRKTDNVDKMENNTQI